MTRMKIIKMLRAVCDRNDGNPEALKQELSAMLGDIAKTLGTFIGATSESPVEDYELFGRLMSDRINAAIEARSADGTAPMAETYTSH